MMMMLDSDSDDDLIPSAQKFNAIFANVHKQVRKEETATSAPTPLELDLSKKSSSKTKKSKKPEAKIESTKSSSTSSSSAKKSKLGAEEKKNIPLSEDTEDILAQLRTLTSYLPPPVPKESYVPVEVQTSRTRSGRIINKKKVEPVKKGKAAIVVLDDDVLPMKSNIDDKFLDDSLLMDTDEIVEIPVTKTEDICHLHVRWGTEVMRFKLPAGTKFSKLRMEIANKVSVRADNLVILDDMSEEISDNVFIESITFGKVLEAFPKAPEISGAGNSGLKKLDPNSIQLKVQGVGGYRERLVVIIKRTTHVKQLIDDYVDKFKLHGKEFKLIFDGEEVSVTETPESLDLDGGEQFDIVERN